MRKFRKVYVEITNNCNLQCGFCQKSSRLQQTMPVELFQKILKELKPYTNYIYLHVKGEPLLHPQIEQILDECEAQKFVAVMVTNGTLLEKKGSSILDRAALRQVNISLHCYNELPESLKENYLFSLLSFAREAIEKTSMNISLRIWNLNKYEALTESNQFILQTIQSFFSIPYSLEEKLNINNRFKLKDQLYLNADYQFEWPEMAQESESTSGFCQALRDHVAILADGSVVPCCLDGEGVNKLGSIVNQKFSDIIQSERALNIYNGFSNSKAIEPLCRKCSYKNKFRA